MKNMHGRYGRIVVLSLLASQFILAQNKQEEKDFYTAIASNKQIVEGDRPLEKIGEKVLPDKELTWSDSKKYRFTPLKKITTKQEMEQALGSLRNQYATYLQDIAPKFQSVRQTIRIDSMLFRYETKEDCLDFSLLSQGGGKWEQVAMPYYHGPHGVATAWYRKEFELPKELAAMPAVMLHFNGSDYYTDAYINGHHVGYHEGMLDEFEFNIKKYLRPGKNTLLVKVRNDYSMLGGEATPRRWGNKLAASNSAGWDDPYSGWICCPAGFGIYQDLYIEGRGMPYIADMYCRPLLDQSAVELWVEVDLENGDDADHFMLEYSLFGQNFEATVVKNQHKEIRVEGGRVLNKTIIPIPEELLKLWEPATPWLYQMQVRLSDKQGNLLDGRKQQFGMRQFVISETSIPKGRFYLNGKEVRLRGTNTMGFLQKSVMAHDWERLTDDLLLAKLTNINFIRTTQRIVPKEVYEYADRVGMMMQADLPLFAYINQKQYTEILKQASGIERVLRNHPSVILMSYLNESMAEKQAHAISRYAYERLFDALDVVVHNENPERAVKYVDGDYQAPNNGYPDNHCYNIWYDKHGIALPDLGRGAWMKVSKGWMYGCGEFGAEGLDFPDLMKRRYPAEWLKKEEDGTWNPQYMYGIYTGAQTWKMHWNWFETQYTMEDWVRESHQHQAWGINHVSRAFRRMPRMNSFAIHLFIDAWPNCWMKAIMDCERTPKPAWFVYRDALTPLSVQVETERTAFFSGESYPFKVWICNDTQENPEAVLKYTLELNGKVINSGMALASVPNVQEAVSFQGFLPVTMPQVKQKSSLVVRVGLFDKATGKAIHEEQTNGYVYPIEKCNKQSRVYLVGESKDADAILKQYGLKEVVRSGEILASDLVIVSDSLLDSSMRTKVETAVKAGARALVLKDAVTYQRPVFNLNLSVETVDKDSWIVFRNKTHRWLAGSESTDLKYVYSSVINAPDRYEYRLFTSKDVTPVLTYREQMVLGEKQDGKGSWVVCSMKLNGKLDTTPVLARMFRQIVEGK
ncbi:MAG: hypothetical protein E7085_06355 [Parabacteroides distasonis]|nr:hypothetical protein [Parabacteroides distasonis]